MTAWEILFESLLEVIDNCGQHEFVELSVLYVRMDRGTDPMLDGR